MAEYLEITIRGQREPVLVELQDGTWQSGAYYVTASGQRIERCQLDPSRIRKASRAILTELPNDRHVLVPV